MLRGFIAGGLWGILISAVVLALTSQLAATRDLSPAITVTESEAEIAPAEDQVAALDAAPEAVPSEGEAPEVDETTPQVGAGDEISAPRLDTDPPVTPVTGGEIAPATSSAGAGETPTAPDTLEAEEGETPEVELATAPSVDVDPDPQGVDASPVPSVLAALRDFMAPTETTPVPDAPRSEETAAVTPPPSGAVVAGGVDAPPVEPTAPEPVLDETLSPSVAAAVPDLDAPSDSAGPETPADVAGTATAPAAITLETPVTPDPLVVARDEEPEPLPTLALAERTARQAEEIEVEQSQEIEQIDGIEILSPSDAEETGEEPQVLRLAEGQTGESALPGKRVSSLPQITTEPDTEGSVVAEDAAVEETGEEPVVESAEIIPAIDRNRVDFSAPEGAALVAVVLMHQGGPALTLPERDALLVPLTLAVPAGLPNAAEVSRSYREAGHEVALIPSLPPRAKPQDVAVAMPVNLERVSGAVAIMDGSGEMFQGDLAVTEGVVAAAAEAGLGVLTWSKGFNSAERIAEQDGVPSASVFRTLEESNSVAIARIIDQVAFRARQEGGVVLVGPATNQVVVGLSEWVANSRRGDTVLAPLSAILSP